MHHLQSADCRQFSLAEQNTNSYLPEIVQSEKEKCKVCNLEAHGMHFGVMACRPCAAFFRRIVVLDLKYLCNKNDDSCNVDGRGRNVCRHCRFRRCIDVGMTANNVQFNRDSRSKEMKRDKAGIERRGLTKSCERDWKKKTIQEHSFDDNSLISDKVNGVNDELEMDQFIDTLKNMFIDTPPITATYLGESVLRKMTIAILDLRKNQVFAQNIKFTPKVGLLTDSKSYYERKSEKFTKWAHSSIPFFTELSDNHKLEAIKFSFTLFDTLERSEMTVRVFRKSAITDKKLVLGSNCAIDLNTVRVEPEALTDYGNNYVTYEFFVHVNAILEGIVKPMCELQLTDEELVFILSRVLVYTEEKVPASLFRKFEALREQIASDLHNYYVYERNLTIYSGRLLKLNAIVKSMMRIHYERLRKCDLIQLFKIYDVSDKRQEFNCS